VGGLVEKVAVFLREFDASQVRVAAVECTFPPRPRCCARDSVDL